MLEIIKVPITQFQFIEKVQTLCPGKFSASALKVIFDYLERQPRPRAGFSETEVHLPDLCKDFTFQESTPSQCSVAVRQLLRDNLDFNRDTVAALLEAELGEELIGVTDEGSVVWWNG